MPREPYSQHSPPPGPVQVLTAPPLALRLELDADVPLGASIARMLPQWTQALLPWGRFRLPVRVSWAQAGPEFPHLATADLQQIHLARHLEPGQLGVLLHELAHVQCFQRCTPLSGLTPFCRTRPGPTLPGPNLPGPTLPAASLSCTPDGHANAAPPYLPTWFREGLAQRVALGRPDPGERRLLARLPAWTALPDADAALLLASPAAVYAVAWHLFTAWHDDAGTVRMSALFAHLRRGHGFEQAFLIACGQPHADFVQGWLARVAHEAAQT